MECKIWKIIDVNGGRQLIMGEGIRFYLRDELYDQEAMGVHMERYHPIGRMFANRYFVPTTACYFRPHRALPADKFK